MINSTHVSPRGATPRRDAQLRIVEVGSPREIRTALALAGEFGTWAKGVVKRDYGIDVDAVGEHLGTNIDDLLPPHGRLYLAMLDDRAVGIGGLKSLAQDTAELKRFYVQPLARGRGVGRALVERLLDDARAFSIRVVHLETAPFMKEAAALYRSFGFVETSPYAGRELENVPGMEGIVNFMTLRLNPTCV